MEGRRARRVLGVASDASLDDIRRAFHARALVTHPDRGGNAAAFAEAADAFASLREQLEDKRQVLRKLDLYLPRAYDHVDVYDSAARPAPKRDFADVLRGAQARYN